MHGEAGTLYHFKLLSHSMLDLVQGLCRATQTPKAFCVPSLNYTLFKEKENRSESKVSSRNPQNSFMILLPVWFMERSAHLLLLTEFHYSQGWKHPHYEFKWKQEESPVQLVRQISNPHPLRF